MHQKYQQNWNSQIFYKCKFILFLLILKTIWNVALLFSTSESQQTVYSKCYVYVWHTE